MICECIDGPYRGRLEHVQPGSELVRVSDRFDPSTPPMWYRVVTTRAGETTLRLDPINAKIQRLYDTARGPAEDGDATRRR